MSRPPRVLVLRGGAVGDFVLTLPVFRMLRRRWPEAHIEVVGYPRIACLAEIGGLADRVVSLDKAEMARWFSWRPRLAPEQVEYVRSFDLVLSYLYDPDGTVGRNMREAGAKQVLYADPRPAPCGGIHAVDHLLKPLEALALYPEGEECPQLALSESCLANGVRRLGGNAREAVILQPGSGSPKKNWPVPKFMQLAWRIRQDLALRPVFLLGEAEEGMASGLRAADSEAVVCEGLSLAEAAELLSAGRAYVGNDSGITHLAAALGLPVVAIFGPTDPAVWGPRGARVRVMCPAEPTTEKMAAVPVERIFSELADVLRAAGLRQDGERRVSS